MSIASTRWLFTITALLCITITPACAAPTQQASSEAWWKVPYPETFDKARLTNTMPFIRVEGNQFVDEQGKPMVFRGVNISDPDKLARTGKWTKDYFAAAKDFGANTLRVPVHPVAWRERGKDAYFQLLDQAVVWANALDLYLIIDWHSIGNLKTGLFQHPMYQTSLSETYEFWRQVARRYKGVSTIAVYELFNEPTIYSGQLGDVSWDEWREINEAMIRIVFAHDTQVIPMVAGFNWAYDLSEVAEKPIRANGIAYAAHPYPTKSKKPIEEKPADWEATWGYVADTYPMIATEIGWLRKDDPGAHVPVIDDGRYGPVIVDYLEGKGISWTVWCFDPDWPPQMIKDWDYTPTEQGEFFREVMRKANR